MSSEVQLYYILHKLTALSLLELEKIIDKLADIVEFGETYFPKSSNGCKKAKKKTLKIWK